MSTYPKTVAEVLSKRIRYKRGVLTAVRRFARSKPWQGTNEERKAKFLKLHDDLCTIFGKQTKVTMLRGPFAYYDSLGDWIVLPRLSVVTYLHEFAHAILCRDERKVCRWSINLFKRCFPRSYAKCEHVGHLLQRRRES